MKFLINFEITGRKENQTPVGGPRRGKVCISPMKFVINYKTIGRKENFTPAGSPQRGKVCIPPMKFVTNYKITGLKENRIRIWTRTRILSHPRPGQTPSQTHILTFFVICAIIFIYKRIERRWRYK